MVRKRSIWRHLSAGKHSVRAVLGADGAGTITKCVAEAEKGSALELRVAIEGGLTVPELVRRMSPRDRGIEAFAELRAWDTERNSGVLLYVLLADRDVEIIADRGWNGRVGAAEWEAVCSEMEREMRSGDFVSAICLAISLIGDIGRRHFPDGDQGNELPDTVLEI